MSKKSTANDVAARLIIDLSGVRERIQQLKHSGSTMDDIHALREELPSLIKIQSIRVES